MEHVIKQNIPARWAVLIFLLLMPFIYFVFKNQGLSDVFRPGAPDGQFFYLLSRLLGICAFIILCWQIVLALLEKTNQRKSKNGHLRQHIIVGSALLCLILLHAGLFVTAVSLRSGHVNLHPLIMGFNSGYYTIATTLGVLALLFTLIAITAGGLRKRIPEKWKSAHVLTFVVMGLVVFHAWMIGSDVQSPNLQPLFWFGVICVALLSTRRLVLHFKR